MDRALCYAFDGNPLLNAEACATLSVASDEASWDFVLWLELLILPVLGLLVVTYFLLEEHRSTTHTPDVGDDRKKDKQKTAEACPEPSTATAEVNQRTKRETDLKLDCNDDDDGTIRLVLVSKAQKTKECYKIESHLRMSEVLRFYCAKMKVKNVADMCLEYQGFKLNLTRTAFKLGLEDMATVFVAEDYQRNNKKLLEQITGLKQDHGKTEHTLKTTFSNLQKLQHANREQAGEIQSLKGQIRLLQSETTRLIQASKQHEKAKRKSISALQSELQTTRASLTSVETQLLVVGSQDSKKRGSISSDEDVAVLELKIKETRAEAGEYKAKYLEAVDSCEKLKLKNQTVDKERRSSVKQLTEELNRRVAEVRSQSKAMAKCSSKLKHSEKQRDRMATDVNLAKTELVEAQKKAQQLENELHLLLTKQKKMRQQQKQHQKKKARPAILPIAPSPQLHAPSLQITPTRIITSPTVNLYRSSGVGLTILQDSEW